MASVCEVSNQSHFNPRTPCGVRPLHSSRGTGTVRFQSTHPLRGATLQNGKKNTSTGFQSTHPLRGATDLPVGAGLAQLISIHAPLAGCDVSVGWMWSPAAYFNPRTPCGVRHKRDRGRHHDTVFQSTHPLRGATTVTAAEPSNTLISIHAPLAGCDGGLREMAYPHRYFNPRTPCGVRLETAPFELTIEDFNPRTPCGVRPRRSSNGCSARKFQSTHPLRGATLTRCTGVCCECISIHAPLAGCDQAFAEFGISLADFNPRTPCGVRRHRSEEHAQHH